MSASGRRRGCVTKRWHGAFFAIAVRGDGKPFSRADSRLHLPRPREAIECLKRALIGADPMETTIHLRLAKLYHDLGEFAEAANYHRHVVELCMSASEY